MAFWLIGDIEGVDGLIVKIPHSPGVWGARLPVGGSVEEKGDDEEEDEEGEDFYAAH